MIRAVRTFVRDDGFAAVRRPSRPVRRGRGSRQHYFHFLLGYLLPLVHEQLERGLPRFRVVECGPLMTPHLTGTLRRLGWPCEVTANRSISRPVRVPRWDVTWSDAGAVRRARELIRSAWEVDPGCTERDCPRTDRLLLERSPSIPYYRPGGRAEIPRYGTDRRSITNVSEISSALRDRGVEHAVYAPGRHSLGCQIAVFGRATHVAGIRGAEWANVIWTAPGGHFTVFDPAPPARLLSSLFDRLGASRTLISVAEAHSRIDPSLVERALTEPV